MSDGRSRLDRFVQDFGKLPEGEPRSLIPKERRIPVLAGIVLVSVVVLLLLLWLVVLPAIHGSQGQALHSEAPLGLAKVLA